MSYDSWKLSPGPEGCACCEDYDADEAALRAGRDAIRKQCPSCSWKGVMRAVDGNAEPKDWIYDCGECRERFTYVDFMEIGRPLAEAAYELRHNREPDDPDPYDT